MQNKLPSLAAPFVASCSDWTETEAESFPEEITSEEYYAALRAYKQTDHQVAFGWYSGWNAEGAFMKTSLAGIPDSMDIVSIWDNGLDLSDAQKRDMQFVQQVKGTKIIYCSIIDNIGKGMTPKSVTANWEENGYASEQDAINEFWGWPEDESNAEAVENAIRTYARAVSEETVVEMVKGAMQTLEVDYAMATSGIAGPAGGTPEKPVGTIWIAAGNSEKVITAKLTEDEGREKNIQAATKKALQLLLELCQNQENE